ncbi:hypothetical protein SEA_SPEEDDEMON_1580 [Gordonia phage SpeedDemon]|nr:hypothetical protein SEA_SPEEDDEMON_1580 [Gordonia phage SpeedDemon]
MSAREIAEMLDEIACKLDDLRIEGEGVAQSVVDGMEYDDEGDCIHGDEVLLDESAAAAELVYRLADLAHETANKWDEIAENGA